MIKTIEQLKEALRQEIVLYEEILKLEKEKIDIIRIGDMKELEKTTLKEQQYLMKLGTFEKIRRAILTNASQDLGLRELSSVSDLLLHLKDENAVRDIDHLRNQLLDMVHGIQETNKLNEKLINQHLEYINFNVELLTSSIQSGGNYGDKAIEKEKQKVNLFDAKV